MLYLEVLDCIGLHWRTFWAFQISRHLPWPLAVTIPGISCAHHTALRWYTTPRGILPRYSWDHCGLPAFPSLPKWSDGARRGITNAGYFRDNTTPSNKTTACRRSGRTSGRAVGWRERALPYHAGAEPHTVQFHPVLPHDITLNVSLKHRLHRLPPLPRVLLPWTRTGMPVWRQRRCRTYSSISISLYRPISTSHLRHAPLRTGDDL